METSGKPGTTGITRLINAGFYSWKGIRAAYKSEEAIRQELLLLLISAPIVYFVDVGYLDKILMFGSVMLLLIVELLNSSIEAVVDRIGSEHHELSGKAKDIGSAAVLATIFLMIFTWGMVLLH